jgi:tRNA G10  N-methylase Trm11
MKYLFILGRNLELSISEIKSFLKRTENAILEETIRGHGLLLELEKPLDAGSVDFLGGTLGIGIVLCKIKDIDKKQIYQIYYGSENNFNYLIWDFSENTEKVSEYLKRRFRSEKLKVTEKKFNDFIKTQNEGNIRNPSSNLISEEYFVFNDVFGRIIQKCNYKEIERRDMQKPVRREELSISPRLAKIMINLSEIKENEILLDAFCGIGVILIEALNMDIKAIGIDKNSEAINGAKKNLEWFKFPKEKYRLINNDSSKIIINPVNVLVSEPDFGKPLLKIPKEKEAKETIKQFENLMISVLNNLKLSIHGKFVFSTPLINLGNERIGCDFSRICAKTGLKLKDGFPIQEFREAQIVGREIVVMEK